MASVEVNKFLMRAVSDTAFRERFLADPVSAAKEEGAASDTIDELGRLDMSRLHKQFGHLSRISGDLLESVVAAGHSRDWSDRANIHDNDGHIHDKGATALERGDMVVLPADRVTDVRAVRDALKDPAVLREIENNPELKNALRRVIDR